MESLGINLLDSMIDENLSKGRQAFMVLLGPCWDLFYPYLSNEDIGKIDSVLTEKNLRELYFKQASKFYLTNSIYSVVELEWIIMRGIGLTVCRLAFWSKGELVIKNFDRLIMSLIIIN